MLLMILSCETDSKVLIDSNEIFELVEEGETNFDLDSTSISESDYFKVFQLEDQVILAFFNKPDNSIVMYDFNTKELIRKVFLKTSGPDALFSIDSAPSNFYIKNSDSIFVYSAVQNHLYLISSQAKIKDKWYITSMREDQKYPAFRINSLNPIHFVNGKSTIIGSISWFEDGVPPILTIDLINDHKSFEPKEMPLYDQWDLLRIGSSDFFQPYSTVFNQNRILVSYPKDCRVVDYSENEIKILSLPNPKMGDLTIFNKEIDQRVYMSQDFMDYSTTTGKYHAILSDNLNETIYRFARLPSSMDLLNRVRSSGEVRNWDYSVMIYNQYFEAIEEFTFENRVDLDFNSMFIYGGRLYILKQQQNEDLLSFAKFKLDELE